ncbi:MAG: glycosyltransferase family 2 protein, partial [Flavobacteriaceae bacterium]|nr:glycosyltransferase family 2 protein [Flavobacteriaceae bacterium]
KIKNTASLSYPSEKLKVVWVTDGSDDGSPELLKTFQQVSLFHEDERKGKIHAINRVMPYIDSPIVIFSDANTLINKDGIKKIVAHFSNPKVGCVSGEKRILNKKSDAASGSGEGMYWRYESTLKKWDAQLYSAVGAAGELFAIRSVLFKAVPSDTILDDFIISLSIAKQGYTIAYEPQAYATETGSATIAEELKRKVRIAAGGIQSIVRMRSLLNFFHHPVLSFQYISHRVLRWTVTPLALFALIPINVYLAYQVNFTLTSIYSLLLLFQICFYCFVWIGKVLQNKKVKRKFIFIPYYFFIMNWSVILGIIRYLFFEQSVRWERAERGLNS